MHLTSSDVCFFSFLITPQVRRFVCCEQSGFVEAIEIHVRPKVRLRRLVVYCRIGRSRQYPTVGPLLRVAGCEVRAQSTRS